MSSAAKSAQFAHANRAELPFSFLPVGLGVLAVILAVVVVLGRRCSATKTILFNWNEDNKWPMVNSTVGGASSPMKQQRRGSQRAKVFLSFD